MPCSLQLSIWILDCNCSTRETVVDIRFQRLSGTGSALTALSRGRPAVPPDSGRFPAVPRTGKALHELQTRLEDSCAGLPPRMGAIPSRLNRAAIPRHRSEHPRRTRLHHHSTVGMRPENKTTHTTTLKPQNPTPISTPSYPSTPKHTPTHQNPPTKTRQQPPHTNQPPNTTTHHTNTRNRISDTPLEVSVGSSRIVKVA